jgi:hypothetical protein
MSRLQVSGNASGTGVVTLAAPNTNSTVTLNLPVVNGTLNSSGSVNEVPVGSAAAPSIYSTGDTNTGLFFPDADTIAFTEGGVESMRINASGNVGIGTTSANASLHVAGPMEGFPTGNGVSLGAGSGGFGRITLIGPQGGFIDFSSPGVNNYKGRLIYANSDNSMAFHTNVTERMRLGSDGAMYLGTTTNPLTNSLGQFNVVAAVGDGFNIKHTINGNNLLNLWQTGTTNFAAIAFYKGNAQNAIGNISVNTTAVTYNTTSDYRLKENIAPMTGALAKIAALKPCTYTWKTNGVAGQGFIAHELQAVVPQCVTGEKDEVYKNGNPKYQGVDTSFLVATLVAAIQELKNEIDILKGN